MIKRRGSIILVGALLLLVQVQPAAAQSESDRVDSVIASQMSIRHIPGLALAVIRDGVPVKVKGYGFANVELSVPVSPNTVFESASLGKQFTAALVMLLVEQGSSSWTNRSVRTFRILLPRGAVSPCGTS